jgi:hypothetical protein
MASTSASLGAIPCKTHAAKCRSILPCHLGIIRQCVMAEQGKDRAVDIEERHIVIAAWRETVRPSRS